MTFPIVLAHGIARFEHSLRQLDMLDGGDSAEDCLHYFRLIRSSLRAKGFDVHYSDVSFARGVDVRSRELRANVERVLSITGAARVHIIAHSMGGLDARHMLFDGRDDRIHEKVASLTTIGTPHLGTSFADWGIHNARSLLQFFEFTGMTELDGFRDLTREACRAFDRRAESFERNCGVRFQTISGTQELSFIFAPLQVPWLIINQVEGANDGLVPRESAIWRREYLIGEIDADHLNQIGWWDPNELGLRLFPSLIATLRSRAQMKERILSLYLEIAQDLARRFP